MIRSSVGSTLASGAKGLGLDPRSWQGNVSVSGHIFLSVSCRDDTKLVCWTGGPLCPGP